MNEAVFYEGGGFRVSDSLLTTPRKSYALARIEYVSVTRPLLFFLCGPSIGLMGFTLGFWRYLHAGEIMMLIGVSVVGIILGCLFGTLRVHSLALRDDEVAQSFGPIMRLREVRCAVEKAMVFRSHGEARA